MSAFSEVEAVVFDVDGTLLHADDPSGVRGAHPIPGAVDAVERVRRSGRPVLFFTNGTGRLPAQAAADLRSIGFSLADEEYMNPAVDAARWIARKHPGKSVLVLGGEGVVAPLRERGVDVIEAADPHVADVVLVGWDDTLTYGALRAACESVWAGATPARTAVVGDDLDLEIAMAKRLGSPTALVLNGISSAQDARAPNRAPTAVLDDVTSFPDLVEAA